MRFSLYPFKYNSAAKQKSGSNGDSKYQPPSILPPLLPIDFPTLTDDDRQHFATQGWASVHLDGSSDRLLSSFHSLFAASKLFFDLPQDQKEKYKYAAAGSEAGWSRVEGEKELITLRTDTESALPDVLSQPAQECWKLCGALLNDMLVRISQTLGLPEDALTVFAEPCIELKSVQTATMLRLFRYEGEEQPKLVAEPHSDQGLLSLVIGDTPGLQVWDRSRNVWYPIEETYTKPTASVLVGRTLSRLTNQRYSAGPHRVISPPSPTPKHRYSIVFILRAHLPVPITTAALTSPFTGPFKDSMDGMTAGDLFQQIWRASYNINVPKDVRAVQKARLMAQKSTDDGSRKHSTDERKET